MISTNYQIHLKLQLILVFCMAFPPYQRYTERKKKNHDARQRTFRLFKLVPVRVIVNFFIGLNIADLNARRRSQGPRILYRQSILTIGLFLSIVNPVWHGL